MKYPSVLALLPAWLSACRHWVHLAWDIRAFEALVHQHHPQLLPTISRLKDTVMKGGIGRYLLFTSELPVGVHCCLYTTEPQRGIV